LLRWTDGGDLDLDLAGPPRNACGLGLLLVGAIAKDVETRFQVHALLKDYHVPMHYTEADLGVDLLAHRELGILPNR
jgi:hypothetical protein